MLPKDLTDTLRERIARVDHPRELAVDVIFAVQRRCGWLSDEALTEVAAMLGMTPLEVEEIATFYEYIYREPVGRYVIHVCDGVVCWMENHAGIIDRLRDTLAIGIGETTADGLFTLLPACCLGYCDRAPAVMINWKVYGPLTSERLDALVARLRAEAAASPSR
jgi:NADH-quinone oxidoreductase subunit E